MPDIIIKNGTLIDGTNSPRHQADLSIQSDRIQAIGDLSTHDASMVIDATNKIVAPGFVDVHNHSDGWLLKIPNFLPKTKQGFTTEVIMADGISYAPVDATTQHDWFYYMRALNGLLLEDYRGWHSLADYMQLLDGANAQNAITHIPYAHLRTMACGWSRKVPDDFEMGEIVDAVEKGMDEGAVGLSTGLDYAPEFFATTDELVEASAAMSSRQGVYVTHVRYKKGTLEGIQEAVEIGRRAKVPVHISHLKSANPAEIDTILSYIDEVAVNEVEFTFDVYPYIPGSTMLNFLLPYDIWEDGPLGVMARLKDPAMRTHFARYLEPMALEKAHIAWLPGKENAHYIGTLLSDYVEAVDKPAADALCDLLIDENLAVLLVFHHGDDKLVHSFLSHDKYMMGSDGIYFPDGQVHPRMYGSAGRLLGPCVRDHKLFSLEEAVYKMSGHAAERFGLKKRSKLKEGNFADVVVFDADAIVDKATYDNPHQFTEGVEHVLVNGVPIIRDGEEVKDLPEKLPGRYLKYNA